MSTRWDDRRALLDDQIAEWDALLEGEYPPPAQHFINALTKRQALQSAILHVDVAEEMERTESAEERARIAMVMAAAAGSHIAAEKASRELDRLRQDRLAREAAEAERAALSTSPTEALQALARQLLTAPQGDRAWLAAVLSSGRLPD
jgi:hypothetical protein